MKRILAVLVTIVFVAGITHAAEEAEEQNLVLDLTCNLPASGDEVDSGVVVARLYEYNPMLADKAASEIAKVTISGLTHKKGKDTVIRIPLHGKRSARKNYYITVFVHPSIGEQRLYFIDGFQKVFDGINEQALNITLTPVGKKKS